MVDPVVDPKVIDLKPLSKAEAALSVVNMLHDLAAQAADDQDHGPVIAALRELQKKPGVRTTEFWIAMALSTGGFGLQFWPGHEIQGTIIAMVASSLYLLSRTAVKLAEASAPVPQQQPSYLPTPQGQPIPLK